MAVLELTFRSEVLGFDQNVMVILPEPENLSLSQREHAFDGTFPVLYLLHGYTDDHNISASPQQCRTLHDNGFPHVL